jgi:hypothetical protein
MINMDISNNSCPICMEPIGINDSCTTKCGHSFCLGCLAKSLQDRNTCPLCRQELVDKEIKIITEEELEVAYSCGFSDGTENLDLALIEIEGLEIEIKKVKDKNTEIIDHIRNELKI